MRINPLLVYAGITAGLTMFNLPAIASPHSCAAETSAPATQTQDAKAEANALFQDIQVDARKTFYNADLLQSFAENSFLTWDTQGGKLTAIKEDVNDIEGKLCHLEAIRNQVAPWQQESINDMAKTARLLVDNTQDAIVFGNSHQLDLWLETYRKYTDNIYDEAHTLTQSVDRAVARENAAVPAPQPATD